MSVERIVSGPGTVDIYETLAAMEGRPIAPLDDRTIWGRAIGGEDALAAAAADRFVRFAALQATLRWRRAPAAS